MVPEIDYIFQASKGIFFASIEEGPWVLISMNSFCALFQSTVVSRTSPSYGEKRTCENHTVKKQSL